MILEFNTLAVILTQAAKKEISERRQFLITWNKPSLT